MADEQATLNFEKLPRRNFLKGVFSTESTPNDSTEDRGEPPARDERPTEPLPTKSPRKKQYGERDALRQISYGVYILTTGHDTTLNAITCNWVTQISFKPLLVLVAIEKASFSHQLLQQSEIFALNLLDREQSHLARRMAAPHRHNPHKLAGVTYHPGQTGVPLLDDALAWLECEIKQTVETEGDHTLFIGEVIDGGVSRRAEPLTLLASGLRYK
jgi:flavin reductase (DIM6/NTAB) family NADH-FMN oxidoreductase RutF